jgi:predicted O-methyltransferase YrrM
VAPCLFQKQVAPASSGLIPQLVLMIGWLLLSMILRALSRGFFQASHSQLFSIYCKHTGAATQEVFTPFMSNHTIEMTDTLYRYFQDTTVREPDVLKRLREKTTNMGRVGNMQICPEQGQFMGLLVELIGATRLIEVGTFTGYSSLSCALALPPDGTIIACDINAEWTKFARQAWTEAGVADKIDLRLASATETLQALLNEGKAGYFDMAFIDADKQNYDAYYELCLQLVRRGGLILVDNVLWGGSVADSSDQDENTIAIRELNAKLYTDERITLSMLPIGDGLSLARKR